MNLIYIGEKFYRESSTMMSSIYHTDGRRSDWGKVNIALQNGETVTIRPATAFEIEPYEKELADMKASWEIGD